MSERFEKLFSLPENMYAEDAPVLIAQGSLLKDHQTERLLVQLKLKNISEKTIRALKVRVTPQNAEGEEISGALVYPYVELSAERDAEFGQKAAAVLSSEGACGFSACVTEVTFDDGTNWLGTDAPWSPVPAQKMLFSLLQGDMDLVQQYQMEYCPEAQFQPVIDRDLWLCTCGAVNHRDEEGCHVCGCTLNALSAVNFRELNEKKLARLQGEVPQAEEGDERQDALLGLQEDLFDESSKETKKEKKERKKNEKEEKKAQKKEKKAQKKGKKKGLKIFLILLLVLAILGVGGYFGYGFWQTEMNYRAAAVMVEEGKYPEAAAAFEQLGEYKDSAEQMKNAQYLEAVSFVDQARYEEAIRRFELLGDYKDCDSQIMKAKYAFATLLFENGQYQDAVGLYRDLGDYEDSVVQLRAIYKHGLDLVKDAKYDEAIEVFTSLGDFEKSPGLLLCTRVSKKMATSMSSVTAEDISSLPKDYAYAKNLAAHFKRFAALRPYCGVFTCSKQEASSENVENKVGHTLLSDFQLVGGKFIWVFSDDANAPTSNSSKDFRALSNFSFFANNRTLVNMRVVDRYVPAGQTVGTATITFKDNTITYQKNMTLTDAEPETETLVFEASPAVNVEAD